MGETTTIGNRAVSAPVPVFEQIADDESRFQNLVDSLPDAILVHCENRIVFVNPFCVRLHGSDRPEQLLGRNITDLIVPEDIPAVRLRVEECLRTGEASTPLETVLITSDGRRVDIEAVTTPIIWNSSPAIEVVLRDICKRRRAQEAAYEWHKRVELAQKSGLALGLWDWDVIENTVVWSDETYRQFGYTRETFSGRVEDASDRIHPEDRPWVENAIRDVLLGHTEEYEAQYRLVHPDGTVCWVDAHGVMVRNGTTHMIGIGADITHLKQAEQAIQASEQKYRNLFENATYGIFLSRPDGTLLDVNPALVTMLGYSSKEELLARNLETDIYEDPAMRQAIIGQLEPGGRVRAAEANWKRKDGGIVAVRLDGGVFRAKDGSVSHFEVMAEDVTERRSLEEQFRQSQKMEAVGLLAGGISHDFNNLLGVILGNADLLLEKLADPSQAHYLESIRKAGKSAAQLVRQLLAFSRKQVLYPAVMDMNSVVSDTGQILRRLIGEDVRVKTDLQTGLGSIRADRGQLEQILMNLATNARDAMPNGGTFTIRTENAELGASHVARHPYVKPGPYIHLSVSDNGMGMPEEVRARVFEPFFTTKEKGRGTGLGLATVYGIVKQSGGYIWVTSEPGIGTSFDFYFPRVDAQVDPVVAALVQSTYPKGTETILLLEDEDCLRKVTREFLLESGYKVLDASRGDIAVELAKRFKEPISLIISDVVMPEMSGPVAISRLRELHPDAQVLYVSGYAEVPVAQQLVSEGAIVMQKPVSRIDLLKKVDELLHLRSR
jgi:two-component system cell cycle sensor histidine kinase/response regulator CckA